MQTITKEQFLEKKQEYFEKIKQGAVFIYPTDTIYGIGCNATNDSSVERIRNLKERDKNPFSIIAPSIDWIKESCAINKNAEEWLEKLPGPYTFLFKVKNKSFSASVNPNLETIGIRMPDNWFLEIAKELNLPIVSTSVNKSGQPYMTSLTDLNPEIQVDFIVYEGDKNGTPSTIVDLTNPEEVKEFHR